MDEFTPEKLYAINKSKKGCSIETHNWNSSQIAHQFNDSIQVVLMYHSVFRDEEVCAHEYLTFNDFWVSVKICGQGFVVQWSADPMRHVYDIYETKNLSGFERGQAWTTYNFDCVPS